MVNAAYLSSWVFTDLGKDHIERFVLICQWAKDETGFKADIKKFWKKGTYLPSIKKRVKSDNWDYGAWQINEQHMDKPEFRSLINFLYDSGVVNFRIKRVRVRADFLDINTNCAARCVVQTDRKNRNWEWKGIRDKAFFNNLTSVLKRIEKEGLYDKGFVEKYYYITPIRHYTAEKIHSYH